MYSIETASRTHCERFVPAILVLLLATQAWSLNGRVPFRQYGYDEWQITEGLPDNNVIAITQTPDGYLWLGTDGGLSRFNGFEFVSFTTTDIAFLRSDRICALLTTRDGALWIGTDKGLATWTSDDSVKPPVQVQGRLHNFSLLENDAGDIWIGGDRIVTITDGIVKTIAAGLLTEGEVLSDLCFGSEGSIWLAKKDALFWVDEGKIHSVDEVNSRLEGGVICIHEDRNKILWIGTAGGLLRWDGTEVVHYGTDDGLTHGHIHCLYEDRDGTLWIGSGYGLNRMSHGVITSDPAVCGNEYIFTIFEDREGNLWVGTYLGLRRLSDRPIRVMGPRDGLFHRIIQATTQDREDAVWMATYLGGLYRYHNHQMVHFGLEADLGERFVTCLEQGSDGRLWLGSDDGISFLRAGETALSEFRIDRTGTVKGLLEQADGSLLAALSDGVKKVHSQQFEPYRPDLLPEAQALVLHESPDESLWIGYEQEGLYHLHSGQTEIYTAANGLPHNTVYSLCADAKGLWVGTESGIAYVQEGRVHRLPQERDLFREPVYNVIVDENGDLWFCTSRHLALLRRGVIDHALDEPQTAVRAHVFSKSDGLDIAEWKPSHRGVTKQSNGTLWFPSQEGAIVIDPNAIVASVSPPLVCVERCYIDRKPSEINRTLRINPNPKDLEIHYIALNLRDPESIRYRFRLEGHDVDWIEAGARRVAYYNTLRPGDYRFHVTARKRDGLWNERSATLAFVVLPAFYQTWWFRALITGVAISLVVVLSRYLLLLRMRRAMRVLHQQSMLNRERARIARDIHDDLGAGLTEIALLSELGLKNAALSEKSMNFFNRIGQSAHDIVESMDEIVWVLNPKNDTLEHFANYICHFAENFLKLTSIRCRLDVPTLLPDIFLSSNVRHSLFLVVKEALNNVVKHSGATKVRLSLGLEDDCITVHVEDNGRGFDVSTSTSSRGRGVNNMKQRIHGLHGQCDITSQPDQGTCVAFRVPLVFLTQEGRGHIGET